MKTWWSSAPAPRRTTGSVRLRQRGVVVETVPVLTAAERGSVGGRAELDLRAVLKRSWRDGPALRPAGKRPRTECRISHGRAGGQGRALLLGNGTGRRRYPLRRRCALALRADRTACKCGPLRLHERSRQRRAACWTPAFAAPCTIPWAETFALTPTSAV